MMCNPCNGAGEAATGTALQTQARGAQFHSLCSVQATSPGALGPAAGRISVYEQRAKLLFELGRAQARAAAQSSSAAQVRRLQCNWSVYHVSTRIL
jgi:hypothetical protein